jgi:hypothetical protein
MVCMQLLLVGGWVAVTPGLTRRVDQRTQEGSVIAIVEPRLRVRQKWQGIWARQGRRHKGRGAGRITHGLCAEYGYEIVLDREWWKSLPGQVETIDCCSIYLAPVLDSRFREDFDLVLDPLSFRLCRFNSLVSPDFLFITMPDRCSGPFLS